MDDATRYLPRNISEALASMARTHGKIIHPSRNRLQEWHSATFDRTGTENIKRIATTQPKSISYQQYQASLASKSNPFRTRNTVFDVMCTV